MLAISRRLRAASRLSVLLATSSLLAQSPGKCVSFDFGQHRFGTAVLRPQGVLEVHSDRRSPHGNSVLAESGVADIAAIPGLASGDAERFVTVGPAGGTTYTWVGSEFVEFEAAPWGLTEVEGATMVRAASSVPLQASVIGVLKSSGTNLLLYRTGPALFLLSSINVGAQVLDFEFGLTDSGIPIVFVLTANQLQCRTVAGALLWSVAGSGGDLFRNSIHGGQVAWVQADASTWRLDSFGQHGLVASQSLPVPTTDPIVAVLSADHDGDGTLDLIVKTATTLQVMSVGADGFDANQLDLYDSTETNEPCLVTTDGDSHVWIADVTTNDDFTWRSLRTTNPGDSETNYNIVLSRAILDEAIPDPNFTTMMLDVAIPTDLLVRFQAPGFTTCVEIIAWREGVPHDGVDSISEPSYLDPLVNPTVNNGVATWSGIPLALGEYRYSHPEEDYWAESPHFWIELRICMIDSAARVRRASDPEFTLMTMSAAERLGGYPYREDVTSGSWGWVTDIAEVTNTGEIITEGIITVGVITEVELPPPPTRSGGLPVVDKRGVRPQ